MSGWWLASYLALWILGVANLVALLIVLRQLGLLYLRTQGGGVQVDEGPVIGAVLTPFGEIDERTGAEVRFPTGEAEFNLLLFTSPGCAICKDALVGLAAAVRDIDVNVLVLSEGTAQENEQLLRIVGRSGAFARNLQRHRLLGVETIPYGIVTSRTGVVLEKHIVNSVVDIDDLLERATSHPSRSVVAVPV